jgi:Ribbon-helix-helix protein, copG family
MPTTTRSADNNRAYRQRLRAAGGEEVLFQLPRETVAMLDELKERQGLRSRSQALLQLIDQGRATTQQQIT